MEQIPTIVLSGAEPREGAYKTRIGFLKANSSFLEKKRPARVLTGHIDRFSVDNPEKLKTNDFWKFLGMVWPGVENVPRACGSILRISRDSQEPCNKNKNICPPHLVRDSSPRVCVYR